MRSAFSQVFAGVFHYQSGSSPVPRHPDHMFKNTCFAGMWQFDRPCVYSIPARAKRPSRTPDPA